METPSTKVSAATVASVIAFGLIFGIEHLFDMDIPTAVEGGILGILVLIAGYFIPEKNPASSSLPPPV